MVRKNVPYRRRQLGNRLRRMRVAAGMTIQAAAMKLDKARTSLVRIEKGEYLADVHLVRSMMDLYDHWDERLLDATRAALKPSWHLAYGVKDLGYIDAETEASRVCDYPGMRLPALLQTESYLRSLHERARHRPSPEQINNQVTVHQIRKNRLKDEEDPLELVAVVDEAALRREIGGPETMGEQLRHLIDMATFPMVTLQVLPMNETPPDALAGAFTLLDFADPDEPDLLYYEYLTGAQHTDDKNEVREARRVFEGFSSEALSPAESVALIEQLCEASRVHHRSPRTRRG